MHGAETGVRRARYFSRLALAAFCAVFATAMVWHALWLPLRLGQVDDARKVVPAIVLLIAAASVAGVAVYLRRRARRLEEALQTSNVHDQVRGMRRRESFFDHLALACERARAQDSRFGLVVLRLDAPDDAPGRHSVVEAAVADLRAAAAPGDWVAPLGPRDIGLLVGELGRESVAAAAARFGALAAAASGLEVSAGWSVCGQEARDAGYLLALARSRLRPMRAAEAA